MAIKTKILKIGDTFTAENVTGDKTELRLYDVLIDSDNELWAIGIASNGVPWTVAGLDIDDVPQPPISVLLPNPKKKGKK